MSMDAMTPEMNTCLILELDATMACDGKRIAGDCSRKRRFCFARNPAKAAYYAAHRSRRFARRLLSTESSRLSDATTPSA
jgi:hypothetical protein